MTRQLAQAARIDMPGQAPQARLGSKCPLNGHQSFWQEARTQLPWIHNKRKQYSWQYI